MDVLNFVGGGSKLPPGFRFDPTEEEIVFQYLARKTFSHPLPAPIPIPEINISTFDPWELFPGNRSEQERYFYSNKEANSRNGTVQTSTATRTGYWKAIGSAKRIICSKRTMPIIGIRKTLVFYKRNKKNNNRAFRTGWIMHEYFIAISQNYSIDHKNNSHHQGGSLARIGNWTLCRIFMKKRRNNAAIAAAEEHDGSDHYKHRNIDLMAADMMSDTDSSSASSS